MYRTAHLQQCHELWIQTPNTRTNSEHTPTKHCSATRTQHVHLLYIMLDTSCCMSALVSRTVDRNVKDARAVDTLTQYCTARQTQYTHLLHIVLYVYTSVTNSRAGRQRRTRTRHSYSVLYSKTNPVHTLITHRAVCLHQCHEL